MFLPFTEAPRTDTQRAFASTLFGYQGASKSPLIEGRAEVTVFGPIAVRVGLLREQHSGRLRPSAGARVQVLSQRDDQPFDWSVGLFYKPEGFTEAEGEIEGVLAFARRFDRLGLFVDLVYGQDPEARERDGEVRCAGLYALTSQLQLGIDSRLRFDLGTESEQFEEEGAVEYDLVLGPVISYGFGNMAVGALAGLSVLGTEPAAAIGPVFLGSLSGAL